MRRQLLGKRVKVTMDPDDPAAITEGTLLGFGDDGSFEIREDDGFVHYCWPMLNIEEVKDKPYRTLPESEAMPYARIANALDVARLHGRETGLNRNWVINQMVRALTGAGRDEPSDEYTEFMKDIES